MGSWLELVGGVGQSVGVVFSVCVDVVVFFGSGIGLVGLLVGEVGGVVEGCCGFFDGRCFGGVGL